MNIAVIGGGVSGIVASYVLFRQHAVTIFEKNDYLGGHTNTIVISSGPDKGAAVDTGFIVFNEKTYPFFTQFLRQLGVASRASDMSFGFSSETTGLEYSSDFPNGVFAQRKNMINPVFLSLLGNIIRFNKKALRELKTGTVPQMTLGEYLRNGGFPSAFIENYIVAMGAAIWSTPPERMLEFPAATFLRFFENHGLLNLVVRPEWRTVAGGSHSYVKAFLKVFQGTVRLKTPVLSIRRRPEGVTVRTDRGEQGFDKVIVAAHADEAFKMLEDPSEEERKYLGPWVYTKNRAVLHTDPSVMPRSRNAWASWNYTKEKESSPERPVSLSYDMNRLEGLQTKERYFVTLNRAKPVLSSCVLREIDYTHPMYTFETIDTQRNLPKLNGVRHTFFCGSYFRYGFHEDAVQSALQVARAFGLEL